MGRDCVVSNTFTQYWEIEPYLAAARRSNSEVSIHVCKGSYGSTHDVPEDKIEVMKDRWEEIDLEDYGF